MEKNPKWLQKRKNYADDRIPTNEEIQKTNGVPDKRIKAIVYTMISYGIRLGAWDYLRWGNVKPILEKDGKEVVAAKNVVYGGEDDKYFAFISREAFIYYMTGASCIHWRKDI